MSIAITPDRTIAVPLDAIIGTYRTFGRLGPVYEVLRLLDRAPSHEPLVRIKVLESGEELEYPLAHALEDPRAD